MRAIGKSDGQFQPRDHHLRFYEPDRFIYEVVADFFAPSLRAGEPILLISTESHRDGIFRNLSMQSLDAANALRSGKLAWLEARETLSAFMVNGEPDGKLFRSIIGKTIERLCDRREDVPLRAFGEMVDLLLQDRNPAGALRLEELWNEVGREYRFALLCTYSIANLYDEEHWRYFQKICDQHVEVNPKEIKRVRERRGEALLNRHIPGARIRDFALRKVLLTQTELCHFADCDTCSEIWWQLKRIFTNPKSGTTNQDV